MSDTHHHPIAGMRPIASPQLSSRSRLHQSWLVLTAIFLFAGTSFALADDHRDRTQPILPTPVLTVSTVPANGDVNPYGVAFVPQQFKAPGMLRAGDLLISNFNNKANLQGTGTTIVKIAPNGQQSLFFQASASNRGLSTALNILRAGFVLVGNFPSTDGTCATATAGSLLFVNANGQQVASYADPKFIEGPWDSTVIDHGNSFKVFVANALSGTVVRLDYALTAAGFHLDKATVIASGYAHACNAVAFVVGPTGLAYDDERDILYVASTADNAVFAVHHAAEETDDDGTGNIIYQDNAHLHGPLGMVLAPNGHLIVANSDVINTDPKQPSELVEFTTGGRFVKQLSVDPAEGGSFGQGLMRWGNSLRFAAVDDNASNVSIWTLPYDWDRSSDPDDF